MIALINGRDARALAIGAGIAFGGLLVRAVVLPVGRSYVMSTAALKQEQSLARREAVLVAERPLMVSRIKEIRDSLNGAQRRVIEARANATASMQLASRLREMARDDDLRGVHLIDLGSDSLIGVFRRVRVQLETQAEFDEIADLLAAIESDSLSMNISEVEIAATNAGTVGTARTRGAGAPSLRLRAVVTALARIDSYQSAAKK